MNQDLGFTQLQSPTPSCQGLNIDIYKLIDKHGLGVWCPSMSAAPPPPPFFSSFYKALERLTMEQKVKIQDILVTIPSEKAYGNFFFH